VIALIVCFLSIAGHYILLNAQFLAMVHIIVYTGAIMVLFLFVIMLLNLNRQTEPHEALGTRVAAVAHRRPVPPGAAGRHRKGSACAHPNPFDPGIGLVRSVGMSLFNEFLLPFESEQRALPERHGRRHDAGQEGGRPRTCQWKAPPKPTAKGTACMDQDIITAIRVVPWSTT
jgi:hypothetical protein